MDENDDEKDVEKALTPKKSSREEKSKLTKLRPTSADLEVEEGQGDRSIEPQVNNPLLLKKLNTQVGS